jgi:hypothetical protein
MDLERLIPFAVMIILWRVISSAIKKAQEQSDTVAPPKQSQGLELLKQLMVGDLDPEGLVKQQAAQKAPETHVEKTAPTPVMKEARVRQASAQEVRPTRSSRDDPSKGVQPKSSASVELPCMPTTRPSRFNRREMQRAVVWAELLGKPLALRDGHRSDLL